MKIQTSKIDTIIHATWIAPVEPVDTLHHHYSIAIHDGRIQDLLPKQDILDKYLADVEITLDNHLLIPGLINTHTHSPMSLMRGLADDLPLMDWLNNHIWPTEQQHVSAEFVLDGSLLACAEMIKSGTTCFNDMYFFPEITARAVEQAGMRAKLGLILIDFPSAWASDADEYLAKGIELHDKLRSNSLISTAFAPHAPYTVSDAPLKRITTYAEELDIPVHIHLHETADEVEQAVSESGQRPIARLNELGLLSPRLLAVHMTQLNDDEIALIAETGAHVLHCPESNLKLASGFCPTFKLQQAGINISLGTDGAASNNDLDMISEMHTAALLAKAVANNASALPAEDILRMATINGAIALGLDSEIGSLEVGKSADITAVDLGGIENQPVYCPVSQLIYSAGRENVTNVWVAGNHLLKDKELTTLDEKAILEKAHYWQEKINT
ncbi:MAG: TRZ/ATZ family hydrolase [Gammaproteobacteria bacterium]|nr:TRZ/ATZ family hydrolase [Gammaproteobacteria bacterium]MCW8986392.1 TRZ/ATZ family hydrolase [Gammaproteobacteria bacterium]